MSRQLTRLTALAAVLVPFAAGCSDSSRREGGSTASLPAETTTTASTGAESVTPASSATVSAVAVAVPSYADAERAFHLGRYDEAVTLFEVYSAHNPDNAWGQYMLGLSAWKTGDHARALEAFDAALQLEPSHRKSLLNSARVLLETGRPKDALTRVDQALSIEPLSAEALRLEGRAYHALNRIDDAIGAYQRAIAIDDRDWWSINNLGLVYIQQGRSEEALLPLARAVELRGNVPVFQNNFGTALERSGHFVSARDAYQKALDADSTYEKAAVGLARVNANGVQSDTSSVDVASLSREFQAQVEQWRSVKPDSAKVKDSVAVDSTAATEMTRDTAVTK